MHKRRTARATRISAQARDRRATASVLLIGIGLLILGGLVSLVLVDVAAARTGPGTGSMQQTVLATPTDLPNNAARRAMPVPGLRAALLVAQAAAVPIIGLSIAVSATLRDTGTLERLFGAGGSASWSGPATVCDLTADVKGERRRALRRSLAQLAVATVVGFLLTYLQTRTREPVLIKLTYFPAALLVLLGVDLYAGSRRPDQRPWQRQPVLPALIGIGGALLITYAAAYLVLGVIAEVLITGYLYLRHTPGVTLAALTGLVFVAAISAALAARVLRRTADPMHFAKQLVARDVKSTLDQDKRPEIMLLRSFQDDDLIMRMHRSARHSPIELAAAQPFERFEELLAWSLWRFGPVCAIGQPGTQHQLQPLGAAREFYSDEDWQEAVQSRIGSSKLIVFVVGRSRGLLWEVANAIKAGALAKCLFVFPPVSPAETSERLAVLAHALGIEPRCLPSVTDARYVIGMYFDDKGIPVLATVDGRDDLAYQTLFEHAGAALAARGRIALKAVAAEVRGPGRANIDSLLVKFDPRVTHAEPPSVSDGLRFILAPLFRRLSGPIGTADDIEAVRRARTEIYELIQRGDYGSIYDSYLSPRCQKAIPKSVWVQQNRTHNAGRDFSGPERVSVSVKGRQAVVDVAAYDGTPTQSQTFIRSNGRWFADVC